MADLSSLNEANDSLPSRSANAGFMTCLRCRGLIIGLESRDLEIGGVGGEKIDVRAMVIPDSLFWGF